MRKRRGRPHVCRAVDLDPEVLHFKPAGIPTSLLEQISLSLDELEALRLADVEGLYHSLAAERMQISRQTFGRIIASARRKVASALIEGKELLITGGIVMQKQQRNNIMTFAIASDDGTHVARHFGRTRGFVIVDMDGDTEERRYVENRFTQHQRGSAQHGGAEHARHGGAEHARRGGAEHARHGGEGHAQRGHNGAHGHSHQSILQALEGCGMVVAGGMGMRLRNDLDSAGITACVTDHMLVDDVIQAVRSDTLVHRADKSCGH